MKIIKLLLACVFVCAPVYAQAPTPVVVTDANGKSLTVTGVASATQVGSPVPVVITDSNGKVIALGSGAGITFVAANPATCTPGTTGVIELNVAPYTVSYCSATNTWAAIGSGGISSVSSLAATPCTNGTVVYLTTASGVNGTGTYTCTSGVWIQAAGGPGSIYPSAFGAKGDVKRCNGFDAGVTLTITNTSSAVTASCFSPTNTTLHVGDICFATNWSGVDSNYVTGPAGVILPQGTVATVSGTGAFTVTTTAIQSTTGTNGTLFCGSQDDTVALNAAGTAALGNKVDCMAVVLSGTYFFSGGLWNTTPLCPSSGTGPSHYGAITGPPSRGGTAVLVPLPTFTYTGAGGCLGGSGKTCIGGWRGESLFDFTIDGGGQSVGGTTALDIITEQTDGQYENVMVNGWLTTDTGAVGIRYQAGVQGSKNITVDGGGYVNCEFSGFWNIAYDIYCGNGGGTPMVFDAASFGTLYGGGYQLSSAASQLFDVSGTVYFVGGGLLVSSSTASNCWLVRAGGDLVLQQIGCANTNNVGSAAIATLGTGRVRVRDSTTLQGGASATAVNLAGTSTYLDEGGNIYSGTTGIAPTITGTVLGTSPTVTLGAGLNTAERGSVLVTEGTGTPSTGTFILTFNQTFTLTGNAPQCSLQFFNGTGSWNVRVNSILTTRATTAMTWTVDNNAATLTAGSTFGYTWNCEPR